MKRKDKQGNLFKIDYKHTEPVFSLSTVTETTYVVADNLTEAIDKFFNFGRKEGWLEIVDIPECIVQITALGTVILEATDGKVSGPKDA